jgi:hypothetical protein
LLLDLYYANTVSKQLLSQSTGTTVNWWSGLKVKASNKCSYEYSGTAKHYSDTCFVEDSSSSDDDEFSSIGGIGGLIGIIIGAALCVCGAAVGLYFACASCCKKKEGNTGVAENVDPNAPPASDGAPPAQV